MKRAIIIIKAISICLIFLATPAYSQLSPGELSAPHSHLEGMSNCTQCHVIGNRISGEKCLACHTEIQSRIAQGKGYHASTEVKGKDCFNCHSEHNGKNFQLVRMDVEKFDHNLTGYSLSVPHSEIKCTVCHNTKYIADQEVRNKKNTYLGLKNECLSCHADYHHQTLSTSCLNCHNENYFKPAPKFDHSAARFKLTGKHKSVDCIKCHIVESIGGKKFQEFRGVEFNTCGSCHTDPHQNKFGQNCRQCHNEESFLVIKSSINFDHNKTNFRLEDKHQLVSCQACHKTRLTDPLKYDRCTDCHTDYHKGQFAEKGVTPDCSKCHSVKGFDRFSYTVSQHNLGRFPLGGSHEAVPCFECHKKKQDWSFRSIGLNCADCHNDIHSTFMSTHYYPGGNCKVCHKETRWSDISFDHKMTRFPLTGAHVQQGCRSCHFVPDQKGIVRQKFTGLSMNCAECHKDNHNGQFDLNGTTDCTRCHGTQNWMASGFDHNKTAFKLDGSHIRVACAKCHKPQKEGLIIFTSYKLKEFRCESCHF